MLNSTEQIVICYRCGYKLVGVLISEMDRFYSTANPELPCINCGIRTHNRIAYERLGFRLVAKLAAEGKLCQAS